MVFTAAILLGMVSLRELGVDLLPDIAYPQLTVVTRYPSATPTDVEGLITRPLEAELSSVPGVNNIDSVSQEGLSLITLHFSWGTRMGLALIHTREKLDEVKYHLPQQATRPLLIRYDPHSRPIMVIALTSNRDQDGLDRLAREMIKARLEQIEGVAAAAISGASEREVHVRLDPSRLLLYGLTAHEVATAIGESVSAYEAGTVLAGESQFAIRVVGVAVSVEGLQEVPVRRGPLSPPVRVRDLGTVITAKRKDDSLVRYNGDMAIGIAVYKEAGANTIQVSRSILALVQSLPREVQGLSVFVVTQDSDYIEKSISNLKRSMLYGALLVVGVLVFFLRDVFDALLICVTIPISVVSTFGLMYFNDMSLNIMSLGGLALGIGMFVENSIVVVENIHRLRKGGMGRRDSASEGTLQVAGALLASTITTVVVFLPVAYVHGVAGMLFRDQALTVVFSLFVALAVCVVLTPMISARRPHAIEPAVPARSSLRSSEPQRPAIRGNAFGTLMDGYDRALRWSLDHKTALFSGVALVMCIGGAMVMLLPREMMPPARTSLFEIMVESDPDSSVEQTSRLVATLEAVVLQEPSVEFLYSETGLDKTDMTWASDSPSNIARLIGKVTSSRELAGLFQRVSQFGTAQSGRISCRKGETALAKFVGLEKSGFTVNVFGEDRGQVVEVATELTALLKKTHTLADVQAPLQTGRHEILLYPDPGQMAKYGVRFADVTDYLRLSASDRYGIEASAGSEIVLSAPRRFQFQELLATYGVFAGRRIPLGELVRYEEHEAVGRLTRKNQRNVVAITARLSSHAPEDAIREVQDLVRALPVPSTCQIEIGSERKEMEVSFRSLKTALVLATILVFLVLTAQFESLLQPFVIILTVPMGMVGVILALLLAGQSLNVISLIGAVVVSGVVVNDAIVKVDHINHCRRNGMSLREAVVTGSHEKLRPVIMNTVTDVLGVLPTAVAISEGSELQQPLAVAFVGGLLVATLLTIIVVPAVYEALAKRRATIQDPLP